MAAVLAAMYPAMERLYQARDLIQAHLLREALAQAGVDTLILNEHAQGAVGEIPFTHAAPELWLVEPQQRCAAEAVIAHYELPVQDGTMRCSHCGEENPAGFAICWKCQGQLD